MSFVIQHRETKRYLHLDKRQRIMQEWRFEMDVPETFTTRADAKDFIRRECKEPISHYSFHKV